MRSPRWFPPALGRSYSCSTTQIKGKLEWSPPYCLSGWSQVIPARPSWAQRLIKILSKFVCLGVCALLPSSNTLKCSNSPSSPSQIVPTRRRTHSYLYAYTAYAFTEKIHSTPPRSRLICLLVRSHCYSWGHTYDRTLLFEQTTNWGILPSASLFSSNTQGFRRG